MNNNIHDPPLNQPEWLGTTPEIAKTKRWYLRNQNNNQGETSKPSQHHKSQTYNDEQLQNYKYEVTNLTEVNDRYRRDYEHEKHILFFNLYEKQYLLQTKHAYFKAQN